MPRSQSTSFRSSSPLNKRIIATGAIAGAAAGAWAANKLRGVDQTQDQEADTRLIDWEQARKIAVNMNREDVMTSAERERLNAAYRELVQQCIPLVGDYMNASLPPSAGQTYAFDRVDWINANLDAFKHMLAPLESIAASNNNGKKSTASLLWAGLNRRVVSAELGVLLGYLARRVLGQYDIALLGREPVESGNLYYVEPNIRAVERSLQLPSDEFRLWLALHETTHVFEFEAFHWVRPYFNGMLEEYFEFLKEDVQHLSQSVKNMKILVDRMRSPDRKGETWIEAIMTPEQQRLFSRLQATMCVIEGYSNHVMNAVGKDLMPSFEMINKKFEQRQRQRSQAEQLFARITGLDIKMEQYRQGQRFIDMIVEQRGKDAARQVWSGPEALPTMAEIRSPETWMARVLDGTAAPLPAPTEPVAPNLNGGSDADR
jgi:coenzyme F420 biosynthesis associated uncharacterized protein